MNCLFCQQPQMENGAWHCSTQLCRNYNVNYVINNKELRQIEFTVDLYKGNTKRDYVITYYPPFKNMDISEKIIPDNVTTFSRYKSVAFISYNTLILTPQNAFYKLPTLLLFL
jgi:hypothetical protein